MGVTQRIAWLARLAWPGEEDEEVVFRADCKLWKLVLLAPVSLPWVRGEGGGFGGFGGFGGVRGFFEDLCGCVSLSLAGAQKPETAVGTGPRRPRFRDSPPQIGRCLASLQTTFLGGHPEKASLLSDQTPGPHNILGDLSKGFLFRTCLPRRDIEVHRPGFQKNHCLPKVPTMESGKVISF